MFDQIGCKLHARLTLIEETPDQAKMDIAEIMM